MSKLNISIHNGRKGLTNEVLGRLLINERTWNAKVARKFKSSPVYAYACPHRNTHHDPYIYVKGKRYYIKDLVMDIIKPYDDDVAPALLVRNKDRDAWNVKTGNLEKVPSTTQKASKQLAVADEQVVFIKLTDVDTGRLTNNKVMLNKNDWDKIKFYIRNEEVFVDLHPDKSKKVWGKRVSDGKKWHLKYAVLDLPEQTNRLDMIGILIVDGDEWNLTTGNVIDDRGNLGDGHKSNQQMPIRTITPNDVLSLEEYKQHAKFMSNDSLRELIAAFSKELASKMGKDEIQINTLQTVKSLLGVQSS